MDNIHWVLFIHNAIAINVGDLWMSLVRMDCKDGYRESDKYKVRIINAVSCFDSYFHINKLFQTQISAMNRFPKSFECNINRQYIKNSASYMISLFCTQEEASIR